jgi:hypothetical protein
MFRSLPNGLGTSAESAQVPPIDCGDGSELGPTTAHELVGTMKLDSSFHHAACSTPILNVNYRSHDNDPPALKAPSPPASKHSSNSRVLLLDIDTAFLDVIASTGPISR